MIYLSLSQDKNDNIDFKIDYKKNNLINENFFVFDSEHLDKVFSHMYGFSISKKGILTDNYYKIIGKYEEPEPQGIYVMIRKIGNLIILNQDFQGSFGIYLFKNKNYFALSNSYLLLLQYLNGKQNLSLNDDYIDNFIITPLCSYSLEETMIKEIIQIPYNSYLIIDIKRKYLKISKIDYKENSIPLESKEGFKIIDKWIDKWAYIFRSLKKITDNVSFDLSGGFDTRTLLPILLNSGINLNEVLIYSYKDKLNNHDKDLKIATNISSKYGFKLNKFNFDNNSTKWSLKDTIYCSIYSKLGFHKEFYFRNQFYNKPRFTFKGCGGEDLRGAPGIPIEKYKEKIIFEPILGKDFYNSSINLVNRSINFLKKDKTLNNDYKLSFGLHSKAFARNHFGKAALEGFLANVYFIHPLMDPEIRKINYNINEKFSHDLIAYIYVRFAKDLIYFKALSDGDLNKNSVIKAESLNSQNKPYKIKKDYNKYFFIDTKRKSPSPQSNDERNVNEYLMELFYSSKFFAKIKKTYGKKVYNWAKDYFKKYKYFSLRHGYGLLAFIITLENIQINEEFKRNTYHKKD